MVLEASNFGSITCFSLKENFLTFEASNLSLRSFDSLNAFITAISFAELATITLQAKARDDSYTSPRSRVFPEGASDRLAG